MGRIKRSAIHLLLGTAVVMAIVFGGGVALAACVVSTSETGTEVDSESLTDGAIRGTGLRRGAPGTEGTCPPVPPLSAGATRPALSSLLTDRDAPHRFLPASPGVLILLCQFRC